MDIEQNDGKKGSGNVDSVRTGYIDGDTPAEANQKKALRAMESLEQRLGKNIKLEYEEGVGLYLVYEGTETRVASEDPEILRLIEEATMANLESK